MSRVWQLHKQPDQILDTHMFAFPRKFLVSLVHNIWAVSPVEILLNALHLASF